MLRVLGWVVWVMGGSFGSTRAWPVGMVYGSFRGDVGGHELGGGRRGHPLTPSRGQGRGAKHASSIRRVLAFDFFWLDFNHHNFLNAHFYSFGTIFSILRGVGAEIMVNLELA